MNLLLPLPILRKKCEQDHGFQLFTLRETITNLNYRERQHGMVDIESGLGSFKSWLY